VLCSSQTSEVGPRLPFPPPLSPLQLLPHLRRPLPSLRRSPTVSSYLVTLQDQSGKVGGETKAGAKRRQEQCTAFLALLTPPRARFAHDSASTHYGLLTHLPTFLLEDIPLFFINAQISLNDSSSVSFTSIIALIFSLFGIVKKVRLDEERSDTKSNVDIHITNTLPLVASLLAPPCDSLCSSPLAHHRAIQFTHFARREWPEKNPRSINDYAATLNRNLQRFTRPHSLPSYFSQKQTLLTDSTAPNKTPCW